MIAAALPQHPCSQSVQTPSGTRLQLRAIAHALGSYSYRYGDEAQLHDRLAEVLTAQPCRFDRERRIDARNRFDFLIAGGIVVEVKVDGSLGQALRQIERYAALDDVAAVLLATTQRWGAGPIDSRAMFHGKPFEMVRLRRQAL